MGENGYRSVVAVTRLPPLTIGNLALALFGLPLVVILLRVTNTEITPVATLGIYWALALIVIGIAVSGEDLSLPELGFRRPALVDLGYILVTGVSILFVYIVTPPLVEAVGLPVSEGAGAMGAGVGIGMALAQSVTVGIVEEILYRGYPIERLLAYTESSLVARRDHVDRVHGRTRSELAAREPSSDRTGCRCSYCCLPPSADARSRCRRTRPRLGLCGPWPVLCLTVLLIWFSHLEFRLKPRQSSR